MGCCKRPRHKTIEGGGLIIRELLAESLKYGVVTDSIVLTILNTFYCLSQKRFVSVQVNEPLVLRFCITLNLIKMRMLLFKWLLKRT